MPRKPTEDQQRELTKLRDSSLLIVRFLNRDGELRQYASQYEDVINASFEKGDLRGLRLVRKDLDEDVRDLPPDSRRQVERQLAELTGVDLRQERKAELQEIDRLLDRGHLETEDEFRLVQGRIEELYSDPANDDMVRRLDELLATYEPTG